MIITELANRKEAEAFMSALQRRSTVDVTEYPYIAHMMFLVTGLELSRATVLLEALYDLDAVTGPYIACHVFVDRLVADTNVRCVGIPGQQTKESEFNIRQIEGLCVNDSLNHIKLGELKAGNLTSPTEHIARSLGVVEDLPCILIMDACEIAKTQKSTIVSFPQDRDELSKQIRGIVGLITSQKSELQQQARTLEKIGGLFEQLKELKKKRGAPTKRKLEFWGRFLKDVNTDTTQATIEFSLLQNKLGGKLSLTEGQIACLGKVGNRVLGKMGNANNINQEVVERLAALMCQEFRGYADDCSGVSTLDELSRLRDQVIDAILQKLINADKSKVYKIKSIEGKIGQLRDSLRCGVSISSMIEKSDRNSKFKNAAKAIFGDVFSSSLQDVAKPSFWMKLIGF